MSARLSIDERVDRWLNDEADRCEVARVGFAVDDIWEDSGLPKWLRRICDRLGYWIDRRICE